MSDLTRSIEKLSREEPLEAAQNLALEVTQDASSSEREEELPKPFIDKLNENTEDIEQLARLILLTGAANSEKAESLRSAIQFSAGRELIPDRYGDGGVSDVGTLRTEPFDEKKVVRRPHNQDQGGWR